METSAFDQSLDDPGSSFMAIEGVVYRSVGSSGGRTSRIPLVVESFHIASHGEVSQKPRFTLSSPVKISKQLVCKQGFRRWLHWTLEVPQYASTMESSPNSSIGHRWNVAALKAAVQ